MGTINIITKVLEFIGKSNQEFVLWTNGIKDSVLLFSEFLDYYQIAEAKSGKPFFVAFKNFRIEGSNSEWVLKVTEYQAPNDEKDEILTWNFKTKDKQITIFQNISKEIFNISL